jgi:hypothetical protein
MNTKLLKWFMIVLFSVSALTGCYIHHDWDDYYHHDRGYRHDRDRDDGYHRR